MSQKANMRLWEGYRKEAPGFRQIIQVTMESYSFHTVAPHVLEPNIWHLLLHPPTISPNPDSFMVPQQ